MNSLSIKTIQDLQKVICALRENGKLHIRGIARATEIHPMKASRIIDLYLEPFLDFQEINEFGIRARIVNLKAGKEDLKIEDVLRYLEIRRKIKHSEGIANGKKQRKKKNKNGYGSVSKQGYRVFGKGHRYAHRVAMEKKLGRKLSSTEIVHHVDGNKLNNEPENLELFESTREHTKFHWSDT